jgi:uncharacterized LabA/DUF88 family protein
VGARPLAKLPQGTRSTPLEGLAMDQRGYIFVDGSQLFSDIMRLQRENDHYKGKKFNLLVFNAALMAMWLGSILPVVRVNYYFKTRDERLKTMLRQDVFDDPNQRSHWQLIECGIALKTIPQEQLEKLDPKYRDHFRREKGLDVRLACDAITLIATQKAGGIVFLVNDRDYIPLFEAIQRLGGNVFLTSISSSLRPQKAILDFADRYQYLRDPQVDSLFQ